MYVSRWFLIILCLAVSPIAAVEKTVIRVGHFSNITHAQGLIGHQLTRQKQNFFEKYLGPNVEVQWFVYPAGPSAMEGIFTDAVDMTYVGPSPTINAYVKSKGKALRVISGACSGGSALVVHPNGKIKTNADFKGKKIATPQFGNTQDVEARSWLKSLGFRITQTGGDALIVPTEPADQLDLFKSGDLDAVWTIEPWVSRLVLEAGGKVYFDVSALWPETNGKYVTTHLVSSKKFLDSHPDLVKKWMQGHVKMTEWINKNPELAKDLIAKELKMETNVEISPEILNRAWTKLEITNDPIQASLTKYGKEAFQDGFLKEDPDLKDIYDLRFLSEALNDNKAK